MAYGIIDGIDFLNMEAMKYYALPNSKSQEEKMQITKAKIMSGEWLGALKIDGAFYKFIKDDDGNMMLVGRNKGVGGEYVNKIDWVPHIEDEFFSELPNGTCLLGEIYIPDDEGSNNVTKIIGCNLEKALERQEFSSDKLHYYVFDVLAYNGLIFYDAAAMYRTNELSRIAAYYKYVCFADYFRSGDLWFWLQSYLDKGREGMVMMRYDSIYEPGKRPSTTTQKIKREIANTVDCVVIGSIPPTKEYTGKEIELWKYWAVGDELFPVGKRPNDPKAIPVTKAWYFDWAGSISLGLYKDGELVHYGELSGLKDEVKWNWRDYVGKVVEVSGMEIFKDTGAIRHPRFVRWRDDKMPEECTWDQVGEIAKKGK